MAAVPPHKAPPASPPPARPAASASETEQPEATEASIDTEGVRFVVHHHLAQINSCYARAFKDHSGGGRVELAFAITPSGQAARMRVDSNSTGSDLLGNCIAARVGEWQFPRPVGGDYELIYPFVFAPSN